MQVGKINYSSHFITLRKLIAICVVVLLQAVGAFADPCFSELFEFQLPMGPSFDPLIEGTDGNFYGTSVGGGAAGLGAVFRMTPAGVITPLTYFNSTNGANPWSSLVRTPDGTLYGTTSSGGANHYGTVFKLSPDGTLTNLISFAQTNGAAPSTLLLGDDGLLWGIATTWGPPGKTDGAIFKVSTNGNPTFVVFFDGTNGSRPSSLLKGQDGNFYGTTGGRGGINSLGYGTIFKLSPLGVLNTLAEFNSTNGDSPTGLCPGVDGSFYGTTMYGGTNGAGTVFKVSPSGSFTKLLDLTAYNQMPNAFARGNDGNFYGTSYSGGQFGFGTVFKVTPQGVLTTLVSFNSTNGACPRAGMMLANDGNFCGTTTWNGPASQGTIFKMTHSGVLTVLSSFSPPEGYRPAGAVTRGRDGNFYGTTQQGGFYGSGTVFRLTPSGEMTTLVAFHDTNGISPAAPLLLASDGNLYGTTTFGGAGFNGEPNTGYGTVFRITTNGEFSTVCSFTIYTGSYPIGRLAEDDNGNLYGTMSQDGGHSAGSVFKVSPSGTLTTLASLDYYYGPRGGLVRGPDGNFYGTTAFNVFRITPSGTLTTVYSQDYPYAAQFQSGLTPATASSFYGLGTYGTNGTLFELSLDGTTLKTLASLTDPSAGYASGPLANGSDGNLYGMTSGSIFRFSKSGATSTILTFNEANGIDAIDLNSGSDGNLYGATWQGGRHGGGTIFKLCIPCLFLGTPLISNQTTSLMLTNGTGTNAVIEASSNLVTWLPVFTNSSSAQFQEQTGQPRQRFYRARVQ
jgi:uncharacterized repeat protein (TIGR03803 family)